MWFASQHPEGPEGAGAGAEGPEGAGAGAGAEGPEGAGANHVSNPEFHQIQPHFRVLIFRGSLRTER